MPLTGRATWHSPAHRPRRAAQTWSAGTQTLPGRTALAAWSACEPAGPSASARQCADSGSPSGAG
eukprot:scaffold8611_cov108-Isochrysis_galbana.AAC.4